MINIILIQLLQCLVELQMQNNIQFIQQLIQLQVEQLIDFVG